MDKSLLRRAAIQSIALMIAVITFSYTLNQYQTVTIKAVGKPVIQASAGTKTLNLDKTQADSSIPESSETIPTTVLKLVPRADQSILNKLGDNFLVIKKPEGSSISFKLEDLYIDKSIQLTISGLAQDNLTSDMISRVRKDEVFQGEPVYTESTTKNVNEKDKTKENVITKDYGDDLCHGIDISVSQDEQTKQYTAKLLIELDNVYAYITYEDSGYYYIDLRKPAEVYKKILVIDAGHGGKDCGALSRDEKYYEKNMNLDILLDLKKLLDKENIKVYYTRTGDDTVYLRPRVELANEVDCDYFISIHCNANTVSYPNGTQVLYYNREVNGVNASKLAALFSKQLGDSISLANEGIVKRQGKDIFILNKAKVPMVLIEVGYLTNNNDMNYLSKPQNRMEIAKGIYKGILKAYKYLPDHKNNQP